MPLPSHPAPLLALGAALLAAGCAPQEEAAMTAAQAEERQCFHAGSVNSFRAVDDDTVIVRSGVNDYFELELVGICPDVNWSQQIAIRTRGAGSWVCRGLEAELIVPSPIGTQRCPVVAVRKLSEAEAEAMR